MNDGKSVLVVGSIALDSLETPVGSRTSMLGGSASFFSIAASLLAPIKIVGVVGLDYPEKGRKIFMSRGINIENVQLLQSQFVFTTTQGNSPKKLAQSVRFFVGYAGSLHPTHE